jgi:hypothetical protein
MLKNMADIGLVQRLFLPRNTQHGSGPSVYTLARKGRNYLLALGIDVPARYRPGEENDHSYLFMSHTIALNDFLIAAELLARQSPALSIESMLHDRTLKQKPMYVPDEEGRKLAVVMDGWLNLRLPNTQHMCLGLEIDMGTVEQKKWRRKARSLVACTHGQYQEAFGTSSLTVAVLATPGPKRMSDLLHWTELELAELPDKDEAADLFRFASVDPAAVPPEDVLLAPYWYRPFQKHPVPLLEGID